MKEIVKKIIDTEQEVRGRIEAARSEAQKIVRDAERDSRSLEEEHRQNAVKDAHDAIETAKREAEEEKARQIAEVAGGSTELIRRKKGEIETAVQRVSDMILGLE